MPKCYWIASSKYLKATGKTLKLIPAGQMFLLAECDEKIQWTKPTYSWHRKIAQWLFLQKYCNFCSACNVSNVLTEDQCQGFSTKWFILLKEKTMLLATDPPSSHPECIPLFPFSWFPHLCQVPTDSFYQERVDRALFPPSCKPVPGSFGSRQLPISLSSTISICFIWSTAFLFMFINIPRGIKMFEYPQLLPQLFSITSYNF